VHMGCTMAGDRIMLRPFCNWRTAVPMVYALSAAEMQGGPGGAAVHRSPDDCLRNGRKVSFV
jgi:hypothetical protein